MTIGKINPTDTLGRISDLTRQIAREFDVSVTLSLVQRSDSSWSVIYSAFKADELHGVFADASAKDAAEAAETARARLVTALRMHRASATCEGRER